MGMAWVTGFLGALACALSVACDDSSDGARALEVDAGTGPGGHGNTGGTGGTGGQQRSDASAGSLTQAEWEARKSPRPGPHGVKARDCEGTPISQDYLVTPTVVCDWAPGSRERRLCDVRDFCMNDGDCVDKPHGSCTGVMDATCDYGLHPEPCTTDADCTTLPSGTCAPAFSSEEFCDPTGECAPMGATCVYRQANATCGSDGDCTARAGGKCAKHVLYASCEYHECSVDADCGSAERCGCHVCVPATCTNGSCDAGQKCQLETGCEEHPIAFHCTTPIDECATRSDCTSSLCVYSAEHFGCRAVQCPLTR